MPTETKTHNASSSDVCDQVCRICGHSIVLFQGNKVDVYFCQKCGLNLDEIRSGEIHQ
jgi:hypothetical protein